MAIDITHKKSASQGNPVGCADWNDSHDIVGALESLDLIEHREPSSSSSETFSDLDGDSDIKYLLLHELTFSATSNNLSLKPNDIATNQKTNALSVYSSSHGASNYSYLWIGSPDNSASNLSRGATIIFAETGKYRRFIIDHLLVGPGSTTPHKVSGLGQWSDTSTNITSLVIVPASGNITGDLYLYRYLDPLPV